MSDTTRVFVGIPIQTEGAVHFLRENPIYTDLPVHWIREEDLHITLIPPWPTRDVERERKRLHEIFFTDAIPYLFHTIESMPRSGPRVLWWRGDPVDELVSLKQQAEQLFHKSPEKRQFLPHVTIAKFIFGKVNGITNPIAEQFAWGTRLTSVCLYSSHLTAHGSWYEKLDVVSSR